jgi:MFS transporter, DHA1 family, multidrug resistance protein
MATPEIRMPRRTVLIVVLASLVALGPFTIDLYLPALPRMQGDLHATATQIQLTLTGATLGFGLGQLFVGPLSDSVGRRVPLLAAAGLHIAASLGAAFATDVGVLGVFRFAQGMGCTAAGVVVIAVVRDLFDGRDLVRMLANLAVVSGIAPIAAPLLGSGLLAVTDWRGLFLVIAGYGLASAIAVAFIVPESLPRRRRHPFGARSLAARYRVLLGDRRFVLVAVIGSMAWACLFANLAASPFLFQRVHSLSVGQYGLVFGAMTLCSVLVGQATSRVVLRRVDPSRVLPFAGLGILLGATGILVFNGSLLGLVLPLVVVTMSCAVTMPCAQVLGLRDHAARAGTAASLLGAVNFGVASLVTPLVGALGVGSPVAMATVMLCASVVLGAAALVLVRLRPPAIVGT